VAYGFAFVIGLHLVRMIGQDSPEPEVTNHNRALVALAGRFQMQQDSFTAAIQMSQADAAKAHALEQRWHLRYQAALDSLTGAKTPAESLALFPMVLAHLEAAGEACDSAYFAEALAVQQCSVARQFLQVRVDTLTAALSRQIEASRCQINLLITHVGCPSRANMLEVGLLFGAGVGYWLGTH
jgi:hypothetical protein